VIWVGPVTKVLLRLLGRLTGKVTLEPAGTDTKEVSPPGSTEVTCVGPVTTVVDGSAGTVTLEPAETETMDVSPPGRTEVSCVGPLTIVLDGSAGIVTLEPAGTETMDVSPPGSTEVTCVGPVTTVLDGSAGIVTSGNRNDCGLAISENRSHLCWSRDDNARWH
jgi:hypothetical protein